MQGTNPCVRLLYTLQDSFARGDASKYVLEMCYPKKSLHETQTISLSVVVLVVQVVQVVLVVLLVLHRRHLVVLAQVLVLALAPVLALVLALVLVLGCRRRPLRNTPRPWLLVSSSVERLLRMHLPCYPLVRTGT